jgi:acetyltransferase
MKGTGNGLDALLRPSAIAVIGASAEPYAIGGRPIRYLRKHGYTGAILPVNPKYAEVAGLPCYPSLAAIAEPVDCAIIAVPAAAVFDYLAQVRQKGVGAAVIFTAGFAETGGEGRTRQDNLRRFARETGTRLIGPNCVGLVNLVDRVTATFSNIGERPAFRRGNVAILAQSGAIGGSLFDRCQDLGVGVAYLVTTGNEADVETAELIEVLLDDPEVAVFACFVESFKNPERFIAAAERALALGKPVLVLKAGVSAKGREVIASHTGALAASDAVHTAIFRQHGVVRVDDLEDMAYQLSLLSRCVAPRGRRLGVLSLSGGAAALVTDVCEQYGFALPDLAPETLARLRQWIPAYGSAANPADTSAATFGDPHLFPNCLDALSADPGFDLMLTVITAAASPMAESFGDAIARVGDAHAPEKPSATVWISGGLSDPGIERVRGSRVPVFRAIRTCFRALDRFAAYAETRRARETAPERYAAPPRFDLPERQIQTLLGPPNAPLSERESAAVLAACGVPTVRQALATSPEEAARLAGEIGYPVALKVESPDLPHKTQVGGVRLGLGTPAEVNAAYAQILADCRRRAPQAELRGVLVAEMAAPALELIAGFSRDAQFGPMVMVGLGGVYVEILGDVALRRAPLRPADAEAMLAELRGRALLDGARGAPPADRPALVEVLLRLSQLALDFPEVAEVDINPLFVYPAGQGVKAVDALVVKRTVADDA